MLEALALLEVCCYAIVCHPLFLKIQDMENSVFIVMYSNGAQDVLYTTVKNCKFTGNLELTVRLIKARDFLHSRYTILSWFQIV